MNQTQYMQLARTCENFQQLIRQYKVLHKRGDKYVVDMLDDMDKLVGMRLECIKEAVVK